VTPDIVAFLADASDQAYHLVPDGAIPISDGQDEPRGFFSADKYRGLVSFAGTKSILDWLTDARIIQDPFKEDGFVHRGFQGRFWSIWPQIKRGFSGFSPGYPVLVTGHSLGGALASLAAYEFAKDFRFVPTLVTFGSPRVGDKGFVRAFGETVKDSLRIQHHDDLVPRVPKIFYEHVDKLLRIGDDGHEIKFSGIWGMFERMLEVAEADLRLSSVTDHLIENYLPAVRNWYRRVSQKKGVEHVRADQG
jgi:hypothetical protein